MKNSARFPFIFLLFSFLFLATPQRAEAVLADFLGDVAEPLIGSAKQKTQSMFRYVWLMPYAGYGTGNGNRVAVRNGNQVSSYGGLKADGMTFGARGGLAIYETLRIGVDWTRQAGEREDYVDVNRVSTKATITSHNWMLGVCAGLDLPYTPFQGFVTRYFSAEIPAETKSTGTGWGFGISFVLKSPFLLMLERRSLSYTSAAQADGLIVSRKIEQTYVGLTFLLL